MFQHEFGYNTIWDWTPNTFNGNRTVLLPTIVNNKVKKTLLWTKERNNIYLVCCNVVTSVLYCKNIWFTWEKLRNILRGVLVACDYDKLKIIKVKDDIKCSLEKSKSNFEIFFRNSPIFHPDY